MISRGHPLIPGVMRHPLIFGRDGRRLQGDIVEGGRDERGCSDRCSERVEVGLCGRWLEKGTSLNPKQDLVEE
jgi:hypothetical protein